MALYDFNQAKDYVGQYAQRRWNNSLNDNQWGRIGQRVNYTSGNVSNDQLAGALNEVDVIARESRWNDPFGDTSDTGQLPPGMPTLSPSSTTTSTAPPPSQPPATTTTDGSVPPAGGTTPPQLASVIGPGDQPLNNAQQAAQEAVLGLLTNARRGVTLSDPTLQPVSDIYRSRRQRGYERERNALAEMSAANGTIGTGGFETEALGALQGANRDVAAFDANLVQSELQTRRQELLRGIELAAGMGNTQAAQDLQRQLALVEATLTQQDIDIRRALGFGDLDLRRAGLDLNRELGTGDLNLRNRTLAQQGALGRGDLALRLLGLLTQNDQFYSNLGLNAAQMQALLNQQAVNGLFGGF